MIDVRVRTRIRGRLLRWYDRSARDRGALFRLADELP